MQVEFAADSSLEGAGFEPSVPRKGDGFETAFRAAGKAAEMAETGGACNYEARTFRRDSGLAHLEGLARVERRDRGVVFKAPGTEAPSHFFVTGVLRTWAGHEQFW
jgi:hypothetical protein